MTIKEARIAANLTQGEVAKKLNVQQSAVSHWELGKWLPQRKHRMPLARALGVKEDDIEWEVNIND